MYVFIYQCNTICTQYVLNQMIFQIIQYYTNDHIQCRKISHLIMKWNYQQTDEKLEASQVHVVSLSSANKNSNYSKVRIMEETKDILVNNATHNEQSNSNIRIEFDIQKPQCTAALLSKLFHDNYQRQTYPSANIQLPYHTNNTITLTLYKI